jgi:hypothetical protein
MATPSTDGCIATIVDCFYKIRNELEPVVHFIIPDKRAAPACFGPKLTIAEVKWIGHYVLTLSDGIDEIKAIMSKKKDENKKLLRLVKGKIIGRKVRIDLYNVCSKDGNPLIIIKRVRLIPFAKGCK